MDILVWSEEYKGAAGSASLKDFMSEPAIGLIVREVKTNEQNVATRIIADVVTANGSVTRVSIDAVRVIGQIVRNLTSTDRAVVAVAAYGKRGYVLAPPRSKPSEALIEATENA